MIRFSDSLYVGWLLRWLEEQGPSFRKLLNEMEISIPQGNRGYRASVMPVAKYLKLINCLSEVLKDEYIGLRVGMDMDLRDYGYAGELLHYCSSLRECCIGFEKFCKTMSPQMRACFNEGKRTSFLEYEIMGFDSDYCRHDTDLSLVATLLSNLYWRRLATWPCAAQAQPSPGSRAIFSNLRGECLFQSAA